MTCFHCWYATWIMKLIWHRHRSRNGHIYWSENLTIISELFIKYGFTSTASTNEHSATRYSNVAKVWKVAVRMVSTWTRHWRAQRTHHWDCFSGEVSRQCVRHDAPFLWRRRTHWWWSRRGPGLPRVEEGLEWRFIKTSDTTKVGADQRIAVSTALAARIMRQCVCFFMQLGKHAKAYNIFFFVFDN